MTRLLIHHFLPCLLATLGGSASAEATMEGRVELSKAHTAPVVTQRYNIIIKGGIVSTDQPMAVVYPEGSFARPQALPTAQMAQMAQKDLRL